jgi:hypothetical protein
MDPYLEGDLWSTLHGLLGAEFVRQLAPQVRPKYNVLLERWMAVDNLDEISITRSSVRPGVSVVREPARPSYSANAVLEPPVKAEAVFSVESPAYTVVIQDAQSRQLVTAIEILSPANKRLPGRPEYLAKRDRILRSNANLVEVDLLHSGQRAPMREDLEQADYFVLVHRAANRPIADVWPIHLSDKLPTFPVPLLHGEADARIELQSAFNTAFDLSGYDTMIDYLKPPPIMLNTDELAWIDDTLRSAGFRS